MLAPRHLVLLSLEVWDDIWRRNQFLAREWVSRGVKVSFIGPARDISYALRTGEFWRAFGGTSVPSGFEQIHASRPIKLAPSKYRWGQNFNTGLLHHHLTQRIKKTTFQKPVLWVNDHNTANAIVRFSRSALIYDVTDDWTRFDQSTSATRQVVANDRWLCQNADAVVVCSESLFEAKKVLVPHNRLFLVPNGVDIEHYADCIDPQRRLNASSNAPVFGYTGSIHGQRVDVDWVANLSSILDHGIIRFVGPDMLTTQERESLLKTGRVEFCGPKPYDELPALMREMDVMIVPHLVTPFTESLNPLKLWEYLAAGKPIVSTPVAGFRDFPALVRLASTPTDFYAAMIDSLTESPDVAVQRRAAAEGHSWQSRADEIEKVIEFAIANRRC